MSATKQRWAFLGRMTNERIHDGRECYVWRWHPIVGTHPEAEEWHHMVQWIPVAEFWPEVHSTASTAQLEGQKRVADWGLCGEFTTPDHEWVCALIEGHDGPHGSPR